MGDVEDIADYQPHEFFEAMCTKCHTRWIAVVPAGVLLKKLDCEICGPGYVINTGQDVSE